METHNTKTKTDESEEHNLSQPSFRRPNSLASMKQKSWRQSLANVNSDGDRRSTLASFKTSKWRQSLRDFSAVTEEDTELKKDDANKLNNLIALWPFHLLLVLVINIFVLEGIFIACRPLWPRVNRWEDPSDYVYRPHPYFMFDDYSRSVVPVVEEHYLNTGDTPFYRMGMPLESEWDTQNCTAYMRDIYEQSLGGMTSTDPAIVADIVRALGLDTHPPSLRVLDAMLTTPQPIASFLSTVETCSGANAALAAMACTVMQDPSLHIDMQSAYMSSPNFVNTTRVFLTAAIVGNALTDAGLQNPTYMYSAMNFLSANRWQPILRNTSANSPENTHNAVNAAFLQADRLVRQAEDDDLFPSTFNFTRIGIYAGSELDLQRGMESNTYVSHALAASLSRMPHSRSGMYKWPVTSDWADGLNSWNLALSSHTSPNQMSYWSVFTPAVLCTNTSANAEDFMASRLFVSLLTYSLGSAVAHAAATAGADVTGISAVTRQAFVAEVIATQEGLAVNLERTATWGEVNLMYSRVTPGSREAMKEVFISTCPTNFDDWDMTNTGIVDSMYLDDVQYALFICLVMSTTCILTGVGSEVLLGAVWLSLSDDSLTLVWNYSQLLFSLFLTISIYSRSVFCFPFLVLGLWKCGCPEIMGYLKKSEISWQHGLYSACVSNYFQALATLMHHSAGVFVCVALAVGYWPLTRTVSAVTVPLVMQHLIVLIKNLNVYLYMVLALTLEAFWEWQMWSNMQYIIEYRNAIEFAICPMMLAHWLYLMSAGLELLDDIYHDYMMDKLREHDAQMEGVDTFDEPKKTVEVSKISDIQSWRADHYTAHSNSLQKLRMSTSSDTLGCRSTSTTPSGSVGRGLGQELPSPTPGVDPFAVAEMLLKKTAMENEDERL